ncbi:MAG: hypothetical protein PVI23_08280 [Maricaulaceae bacterium]|jgi:hypothetical protein
MMINLGRFLMLDGAAAAVGGAVWSALTENILVAIAADGMRAVTSSLPALVAVAGLALVVVGWIVLRTGATRRGAPAE